MHSNIFIVLSDDGSWVSGNKHCHPVQAEWIDTQYAQTLGITLHDEPLDWAAAGDHVSLTVTGMDIIKIK